MEITKVYSGRTLLLSNIVIDGVAQDFETASPNDKARLFERLRKTCECYDTKIIFVDDMPSVCIGIYKSKPNILIVDTRMIARDIEATEQMIIHHGDEKVGGVA